MFRKQNIGWNIPMSNFVFDTGEGDSLSIPYIAPSAYLQFLVNNCIDLVAGGAETYADCKMQLQSFWAAYQQHHGSHRIFSESLETYDVGYAVPLAIHGDEGRGKRRTGTVAVSLESPLGLPSKKRKQCSCNPPPNVFRKFNAQIASIGAETLKLTAKRMATNTKYHSFLQRWPLIVIPGVVYKAFPSILGEFHKLLAKEMRVLYHEGVQGPSGRIFTGVLIGVKADLKWHTQVGCLVRSYERQGRKQDLACCHHCLGGQAGMEWEDLTESPRWEHTSFTVRPWISEPPLSNIPFDVSAPEKLYRTDPFHTGKVGILRDMVGSSVIWMIDNNYFEASGGLPEKLTRAFGAFKLFCCAQPATPALRSFTKSLFMIKSRKSFPWTNTKGSDTILCLRWVVIQSAAFINCPIKQSDVPVLRLIHDTAKAALGYYDKLYVHGLFLDRTCAMAIYNDGNKFIAGYCNLAHACLHHVNLFSIKPKLHMWRHVLIEIRQQLERGNKLIMSPLAWNTEANEDAIGRLAKLSRRLDSRQISKRILECYLVKAQLLHNRLRTFKRKR
eukprot:Skav217936  [mRNA]  locus=scaffold1737:15914:17584:- [translate_table: standard]